MDEVVNAFTVASPLLGHMFYEVWTNRNRRGKYLKIKTIKTGDRQAAVGWGERRGLVFDRW